jgi:hypothetical protein
MANTRQERHPAAFKAKDGSLPGHDGAAGRLSSLHLADRVGSRGSASRTAGALTA